MGIKDVVQGKPLGHPSHPMFVHFPTALFPTSLLFDALSWAIDQPELVTAAFYNIAVGLCCDGAGLGYRVRRLLRDGIRVQETQDNYLAYA